MEQIVRDTLHFLLYGEGLIERRMERVIWESNGFGMNVASGILNAVGIKLSEEFVAIARNRLAQRSSWSSDEEYSVVHQSNANDLLELVQPESADIIITSPPYWDILTRKRTADNKKIRHYGDMAEDLGKVSQSSAESV